MAKRMGAIIASAFSEKKARATDVARAFTHGFSILKQGSVLLLFPDLRREGLVLFGEKQSNNQRDVIIEERIDHEDEDIEQTFRKED